MPKPTPDPALASLLADPGVRDFVASWLFGNGRAEAAADGVAYGSTDVKTPTGFVRFTDPSSGERADVPFALALEYAEVAADHFATTASRPFPVLPVLALAAVGLWLFTRGGATDDA